MWRSEVFLTNMDWLPAWTNNHMPSKVWNEITYPFPNFSGCTMEVWEWISNFISHFIVDVITFPCWVNTRKFGRHLGSNTAEAPTKIHILAALQLNIARSSDKISYWILKWTRDLQVSLRMIVYQNDSPCDGCQDEMLYYRAWVIRLSCFFS